MNVVSRLGLHTPLGQLDSALDRKGRDLESAPLTKATFKDWFSPPKDKNPLKPLPTIKFNNKEFLLSCEDGQEEHLEELSVHLNEKFNDLKSSLGNIGENKLLLISAITTMDEYFETKKKISSNF